MKYVYSSPGECWKMRVPWKLNSCDSQLNINQAKKQTQRYKVDNTGWVVGDNIPGDSN